MNKQNKKQKLIDQIMKKYIFEDDPSAIVGTEIRLRRNGLSKTLDAISQDTCSVSYLSKIEKNEIKPNPRLLEEICTRLKLSKENIDIINNSKALYDDIIKAAFNYDINVIKDAYEKIKTLKNYRAKLIEFFFYVFTDEMKLARKIFNELNKLVASMLLNDLIIFAYTEALYHMKLNDLQASYSLVIGLERIALPFRYLDCLVKEIKTKLLYKVNSNLFLASVQELKALYMDYNAYRQMNEIDKLVRLYSARNRYFPMLELDENKEEDHDYLLYEEIINGDELHDRRGYSIFGRLLFMKYKGDKDFIAKYEEFEEKLNRSEKIIINIANSNRFSDEYYHDVLEIYYPEALAIGDEILINRLEDELIKLLQIKKRYKRIIDIYYNSLSRKNEAGFFC